MERRAGSNPAPLEVRTWAVSCVARFASGRAELTVVFPFPKPAERSCAPQALKGEDPDALEEEVSGPSSCPGWQ